MKKREVIIACDFQSAEETFLFLEKFGEERLFLKIGMELFYAEGPDIVRRLKYMGHRVFLDLKLHDIPNTVERTMRNLARLGADMTNLHAGGGSIMMRAALEGLEAGSNGERPLLVAVTQLTSTSEELMNRELLIDLKMEDVVAHYARNALGCGLDGVVCSPLEASLVKRACKPDFLTVTPGIRYASGADDQKRVTTPEEARKLGSDYIVVGRPITAADDPESAYRKNPTEFIGNE